MLPNTHAQQPWQGGCEMGKELLRGQKDSPAQLQADKPQEDLG